MRVFDFLRKRSNHRKQFVRRLGFAFIFGDFDLLSRTTDECAGSSGVAASRSNNLMERSMEDHNLSSWKMREGSQERFAISNSALSAVIQSSFALIKIKNLWNQQVEIFCDSSARFKFAPNNFPSSSSFTLTFAHSHKLFVCTFPRID